VWVNPHLCFYTRGQFVENLDPAKGLLIKCFSLILTLLFTLEDTYEKKLELKESNVPVTMAVFDLVKEMASTYGTSMG
jgi:hypothetical protein